MIVGGWIIAAGHILLGATEFFGITAGAAVTLQTGPGALVCFVAGLALIVIGTGFFKPCVSVMVGQLYGPDDDRRDGGFTIFYMGINVGALLAPLVAGTLGETVGWHWGFGSAAVGMILGISFYQAFRSRYLEGIGMPPERRARSDDAPVPPAARLNRIECSASPSSWCSPSSATSLSGRRSSRPEVHERFRGAEYRPDALGAAGQRVPRHLVPGREPGGNHCLCAAVRLVWVFLSERGRNPSTPMKFALGVWLLGLAFLAMVFGAMEAQDGLAGPHWLLITLVVYTWGELCLSPVGLSMVSKLAPQRLQSLMMASGSSRFPSRTWPAGCWRAIPSSWNTANPHS